MKKQRFILIHGFAGTVDSWQEVAQALPKNSSALRLSILGHGTAGGQDAYPFSGPVPPPTSDSFEEEVDRLATQILSAGFQGGQLVGYSLGGRLALGLLARYPEMFAGASLIGAHPGLQDHGERRQRAEQDESWANLVETEGLAVFLEAWEQQSLFSTQTPEQRRLQRRRRRHLHPQSLGLALRSLSLARMPNYWPVLPDLEVPVQWIAGEKDGKFRSLAKAAANAQPAGSITVVPDAGHNVPLEQPGLLAALLTEPLLPREIKRLENPNPNTQSVMEGSLR